MENERPQEHDPELLKQLEPTFKPIVGSIKELADDTVLDLGISEGGNYLDWLTKLVKRYVGVDTPEELARTISKDTGEEVGERLSKCGVEPQGITLNTAGGNERLRKLVGPNSIDTILMMAPLSDPSTGKHGPYSILVPGLWRLDDEVKKTAEILMEGTKSKGRWIVFSPTDVSTVNLVGLGKKLGWKVIVGSRRTTMDEITLFRSRWIEEMPGLVGPYVAVIRKP